MFKEPEDSTAYLICSVEVGPSPIHGLGCFSTKKILKHELIESCPVIKFPGKDLDKMLGIRGRHVISDYVWAWNKGEMPGGTLTAVLGHGSIYNHSFAPNAFAKVRPWVPYGLTSMPGTEASPAARQDGSAALVVRARRDIEIGEEILICYTPDPDALWFVYNKSEEEEREGYKRGHAYERAYNPVLLPEMRNLFGSGLNKGVQFQRRKKSKKKIFKK
jgi:hypothetical protein